VEVAKSLRSLKRPSVTPRRGTIIAVRKTRRSSESGWKGMTKGFTLRPSEVTWLTGRKTRRPSEARPTGRMIRRPNVICLLSDAFGVLERR
jgi:hypothetical protein